MNWIEKIHELDKSDNKNFELEEATDLLFEKIDDLLLEGKFEEVDEHLLKFRLEELSIELLIGILSITWQAKELLKNRQAVFNKIREIIEIKEPSRIKELLSGLK